MMLLKELFLGFVRDIVSVFDELASRIRLLFFLLMFLALLLHLHQADIDVAVAALCWAGRRRLLCLSVVSSTVKLIQQIVPTDQKYHICRKLKNLVKKT